jgi:hypothetical protein
MLSLRVSIGNPVKPLDIDIKPKNAIYCLPL